MIDHHDFITTLYKDKFYIDCWKSKGNLLAARAGNHWRPQIWRLLLQYSTPPLAPNSHPPINTNRPSQIMNYVHGLWTLYSLKVFNVK